ncbi:peptidase family M28 [Apiospora rasikravindrae]|uniref:Peptide hydrolase n=1 Tax=Apiospora rasikravindrae TaxID=990691 RepID=A0ABR1U025_9PEZI
MVRFARLGAAALHATVVLGALTAQSLPARDEELRLVKTSEDDAGTWMTEEQKFEQLISKGIHFADITDTMASLPLSVPLGEAICVFEKTAGDSSEVGAPKRNQETNSKTQELETLRADRLASAVEKRATFPSGASHQSEANPLIAKLSQNNLQTWTNALANFYNRYYKGTYAATSAQWMYDTVRSVASANSAITVKQFAHSYNQPSVIAAIPGTSGEVVVVSAHYDSIGTSTSGRAPGADDNASGVVVVLEALRVLAEAKFKPANTLEFHFYSGEEGGLQGSRGVMQSYARSGVKVLAVMNQDMTGYSPNNVIAVYTDYVDSGLTSYLQKLVPVYTQLKAVTDRCGYACSDHGSARDAGYPAAYVCDEVMADSSPYIHSANDAVSTLSFPHMLQHAKLTVGFLVEGSYF